MDRVTYNWRDFLLCFRVALDGRRIVLGSLMALWCALAWWVAAAFNPSLPLPHGVAVLNVAALGAGAKAALTVLVALGWWWGFARLVVALMRAAAVEFATDIRAGLGSLAVYTRAYAKYHARGPLAPLLYSAPLWLAVLLWAGVARIPVLGPWIGALTAPLALLAGVGTAFIVILGVATLPLQAAAVAVYGGDTSEASSRAYMYAAMKPHKYAGWFALKLALLALAFALALSALAAGIGVLALMLSLTHSAGAIDDIVGLLTGQIGAASAGVLGPVLARGCLVAAAFGAVLAAGYAASYGTASDVMLFLLLRHRCDGAAVSEIFVPVESFKHYATRMEQEQALATAGQPKPAPAPEARPLKRGGAAAIPQPTAGPATGVLSGTPRRGGAASEAAHEAKSGESTATDITLAAAPALTLREDAGN